MDELFLQIAYIKGFERALNTLRLAKISNDSLDSLILNLESDLELLSIPDNETMIILKSAYEILNRIK